MRIRNSDLSISCFRLALISFHAIDSVQFFVREAICSVFQREVTGLCFAVLFKNVRCVGGGAGVYRNM